MNTGKFFEKDIKDSIPSNVYYLRLTDPAQSFGQQDNVALRFSPSNPFDCLMYSNPMLFCMELKSTKGTAISYKGSSPMIKQKQIEGLTKASQFENVVAGFITNFREPENKVYFLDIKDFNKFVSENTKSSINKKDILSIGGIEIIGELKKVHYKYKIQEFIDTIQKLSA